MASKFTQPKGEEAAESQRLGNDEIVPSYGSHTTDNPYTEDQGTKYGIGLPLEEGLDLQDVPSPTPLPMSELPHFPNTIPATALYSLDFTLNSMGNSIIVRRSGKAPRGKIVDKELYGITRQPMSGSLLFEIQGKRQSTFPATGKIQFKAGILGRYWECRYKNKFVLKGKKGIWTNVHGNVVAREVNEVPEGSKKGVQGKLVLNFEGGIDGLMVDLVVAVWCTTIWATGTYGAREMKHTEKV